MMESFRTRYENIAGGPRPESKLIECTSSNVVAKAFYFFL